ncbi:hypothetical protein ACFXP7_13775 [Microbacterium sp. P06]|uniref:hypothetical protein n=1 Tax=unclassified Microbacterium TaxID=2609290 RepID=UPI003746E41A
MLDDSGQVIAFAVCVLALLALTVGVGVAAGRRDQAERQARLTAERERGSGS